MLRMVLNIILLFFITIIISCNNTTNEGKLKEPSTIEDLGELLFFDSILSRDNQVSCASCHKPQFAFADNIPVSFGVDSLKGIRNTPSAMNQSSRNFQFWDGRMETLEEQAAGPIENPVETASSAPSSTLTTTDTASRAPPGQRMSASPDR